MRELLFEDATHTYMLDGRFVPSVTQVLGPISALDMVDPELLARKAEFGTDVHHAAELHLQGRLDRDSLSDDVEGCMVALDKFLADTQIEPLLIEYRCASRRHQYAGGTDLVGTLPLGEKILVDFKTSLVKPPAVGPQLAGYQAALLEEDIAIDERWCVRLHSDGTYKRTVLPDSRDWLVFLSCLNIWQFNRGF